MNNEPTPRGEHPIWDRTFIDRHIIDETRGVVLLLRPGCDYTVYDERWEPAINGCWSYECPKPFFCTSSVSGAKDALRRARVEFERRKAVEDFL